MKIPREWTFENTSVASAFDKHVREQLPWYDMVTGALAHIARHYILLQRKESWGNEAPEPVVLVTAGVHQHADLRQLVIAIIWHENAQQPYSEEQINKALVLAGVETTPKPLAKTPTIKGAQITASAGVVAAASGVIAEAAPAIPVLSALSQMVKDNALGFLIVLGVMVIFAAGYIAWARVDDRRKGLV